MYLRCSWMKVVGSIVLFASLVVDAGEAPEPTAPGYEALSKGDWRTALAEFDKVVVAEPENADGYYGRGQAYWIKGDLDLAIADLTRAIQLAPTLVEAYRNRGGFYLANGDYDRAIADCDEAIRRDLRDSPTFNNRGYAYLCKGNTKKAIDDLTIAIRLDPKASTSYTNRGRAWCIQHEYDLAITDLNEAIRIDPHNAAALAVRSDANFCKGESAKALADINQAICLAPKSSASLLARACIYAQEGKDQNALEDLDEAIRLDPKSAETYAKRGIYLAHRSEYQKALADFDEAIRLSPKSACFYEMRGSICIQRGDYDRGWVDIQTAIQLNPNDPATTYEAWPKETLTEASCQHGKRQLRQMLHDRPAMAEYDGKAEALCEWAAKKFAGEDLGRMIFWDASEPPAHTTAANDPFPIEQPGAIMVSSTCPTGPNKGRERSFEELWSNVVYELYNVANAKDFLRLAEMAAENKLSRQEFVNGMIECESRAADKTRAFYVRVFLPWAKEHHVSTHPTSWFLAWRSNIKDNLLSGHFTEKSSYWRYYARGYDLIVLDSLTRKGESEKAIELSAEMCKQAETPAERAAICRYSGYCLLRLNKPFPAIDAYNEVTRFDPRDANAFLARATAYQMLHDTDHAMADYAEAVRLAPSNPEVYRLRGNAYEEIGDKDHAIADHAMAKQLTELWGPGQQETARDGKEALPETIPSLEKGWNKWTERLLEPRVIERPTDDERDSCR